MKKDPRPTAILNPEGNIRHNQQEMANICSTLFTNKIKELRKDTVANTGSDTLQHVENMVETKGHINPCPLREINAVKLRKIIRKVKPGRVAGIDYIDAYIPKLANPLIEDAVLHMVNLFYKKNEICSHMEAPLNCSTPQERFKGSSKNYRPVSNLIQIFRHILFCYETAK